MKKFFTLLTAAFCAAGMYAADEQVTMTWALSSTTDLSATVKVNGEDPEGANPMTVNNMSLGDNLSLKGNKTNNNVKGIDIVPTADFETSAPKTSDFYLQFPFTVPEGKEFTITQVSFYIGTRGTDKKMYANVMVYNSNADPQKKSVADKVELKRDNETNGYYTHGTYTQNEIESVFNGKEDNKGKNFNPQTGENFLTFNLYGDNTYDSDKKEWKSIWISSVEIIGTLTTIGEEDNRVDAPISWSVGSVELKVRGEFDAPTFSNTENLPVTFSSSNEKVATVDDNGVISFVATDKGDAVISAVYAGDETKYKRTEVTTKITALSNVEEVSVWDTLPEDDAVTLSYIWKPEKTSGTLEKGTIIADENITVETVYDASYTGSVKNYLGQEFSGAAQLGRVNAAPSGENVTGTENSGNSPIVVSPKTDLQLVVYCRRQSVKQRSIDDDNKEENIITRTNYMGYSENDNKSLFAVAQSDLETKLDQKILFGVVADESKPEYLYVAMIWDLKANEKYTIYSTGTGIHVNGIGYILPSDEDTEEPKDPETPEAPAAPSVKVDNAEHTANTIELSGANKTVTFDAAEGHNVYYHFAAEEAADVPEAVAEVAGTIEHDGNNYTLVPETGVVLSQAGTLSFFAHDPVADAKSEVKTITVTGKGATSGINGIGADANAPVEYYNLQGVRVANPENGIFIRRQGDKVSKVVVR